MGSGPLGPQEAKGLCSPTADTAGKKRHNKNMLENRPSTTGEGQ